MPELRALEVLLVVARTHSLSAAAAQLGVTQQAVSARISSLEATTGVKLVLRTARGSQLTPAGVVVAAWAEKLLVVADELDVGLAALRDDQRTRLRVSSSLTVAEHLLPGWLVSFRAAALALGRTPAEVVLTATNSRAVAGDVLSQQADLGFIEGPESPRGVRSRVVSRDRLVLVVRSDHAWVTRRRPVTPDELAATALVSREPGSGTRYVLAAALAAALGPGREQVPPSLALSTTSAVRAAVLAGAGPAVLSELAVLDDLSSRRMTQIEVSGLDLERELRVIWTGPTQLPSGAARDLVTHIAPDQARMRRQATGAAGGSAR